MNVVRAEWHDGEDQMHKLLHVPDMGNPTKPGLSPHAQRLLHLSSLLAIGIIDDQGQPWTTILAGEPGFAKSLGQSVVGARALADIKYDPVIQALFPKGEAAGVADDQVKATDFAALGIHLASRDRIKLHGKVVAGGIGNSDTASRTSSVDISQVQIAFLVTGSLGISVVSPVSMACVLTSTRQLSKISKRKGYYSHDP